MMAPPRILIAEDDDELRQVLQEYLELSGYQVIAVDDGLELADYLGLANDKASPVVVPDLIVADLSMPGRSSLEVLEQLGPVTLCPFILISGYADDEIRRRAAKLGVTMVLDKPVDPRVLSSVVEALVARGATTGHSGPTHTS
ncbi:MAG: response regulator [Archangium sp.]|nr:response regulator [Archangium sp.]